MKKFSAAYFLILLLFYPLSSYAFEIDYSQISFPGFGGFGTPPTIGNIFLFLFGIAIFSASFALFASILIAGFQYATSSGTPQKSGEAKKRIIGAIIGAVLLFGSFIMVRTINPQLLTLSEQNIGICYTPSAEELAETPAVQQDDEKNRVAAGLPPNCLLIKPLVLLRQVSSSGTGTPGTTPGSSGSASPPVSASCSVVTDAASPAGNCAVSTMEHGEFSPDDAGNASKICNRESGGNERAANFSCIHGTGCDYSVGIFQFNLAGRCGVGSGPGKAFSSYVCNSDGTGRCAINDQTALESCAQGYGVTLDFRDDANGTIVDANVALQTQKAHEAWNDGQGIGHPSFCGNHPDTCSVCNLWSTAASSACNICPN